LTQLIEQSLQRHGYSPEGVLIRFGLAEKAVSSLIIGASSVDQIEKLKKGLEERKAIPEALIDELKSKFSPNLYQDHR